MAAESEAVVGPWPTRPIRASWYVTTASSR